MGKIKAFKAYLAEHKHINLSAFLLLLLVVLTACQSHKTKENNAVEKKELSNNKNESSEQTDFNTLQIDDSKLKKYDEKLYGTYKMSGCTESAGYLNSEDKFYVFYYDYYNLKRWYFSDGKWKLDFGKNADAGGMTEKTGRDDTLWDLRLEESSYDGSMYTDCLYIIDKSGEERLAFKCNKKWKKKNGYSDYVLIDFVPLLRDRCILIFEESTREESVTKSCLYDLNAGEIINTYDFLLDGVQDGNYIYNLNDDSILDVYDFDSGEQISSVNVSIINGEKTDATMNISANNNKVYISSHTGVFEWTVGDNTIYQIVDGENTKFFDKMYGVAQVAADGTIYVLGEMDEVSDEDDCDEGVSDLLVMTPSE